MLTVCTVSLAIVLLTGCSQISVKEYIDNAQRLANAANFKRTTINTSSFKLFSVNKIKTSQGTLRIYLEGDGHAWATRYRISKNPTPRNPVALTLASVDPADNIIYLARPCQYWPTNSQSNCQNSYWTDARYSREVVDALHQAINQLLTKGQWNQLELVGFSGGATLALLVASERDDVTSIRTIAGNLSPTAFVRHHKVSPMRRSLDPLNTVDHLANIPQRHFIGAKDKVVVPSISADYRQTLPHQRCFNLVNIATASHTQGWRELWPQLLSQPLECQ
jgi:predicted esterase